MHGSLLLAAGPNGPAAKELLSALAAGQASIAVALTAGPAGGTWLTDGILRVTGEAGLVLGFCPRGEARHFITGGAIELGGRLPVNPNGGQLGEAYIRGMNGIAEAARQSAAARSTRSQATARCRSRWAPGCPPAG